MPYITNDNKMQFESALTELDKEKNPDFSGFETPGELNYVISCVALQYIKDRGGVSYTRINEVIGVLECAKLELYRRLASIYEEKKIVQNGDVEQYTEVLSQI